MKTLKTYRIIILLIVVVFSVFSINAVGQSTRIIYGSSTTTTSADYAGHIKVAEVGASEIGDVTVSAPGGTVAATVACYEGELDLAGSTAPALYESINGMGAWEGEEKPNTLRILQVMAMLDIPICVREGVGIDSVSDLEGRKVFLGWPGTTTRAMHELIFDALEIEVEPFPGTLSDGVNAFKDKRIDVFIKSVNGDKLDSTHLDIKITAPIKFISYTDEEVEKVREKYPWVTFQKYPAGYFDEFPDLGEIWMYSTPKIVICRDEFPEEWAYNWVKGNVEKKEEVVKVWRSAGLVDILDTAKIVGEIPGLLLHPGAIRYYQEVGVEIPEAVIPPEMK